jgi:hypothetical protein
MGDMHPVDLCQILYRDILVQMASEESDQFLDNRAIAGDGKAQDRFRILQRHLGIEGVVKKLHRSGAFYNQSIFIEYIMKIQWLNATLPGGNTAYSIENHQLVFA